MLGLTSSLCRDCSIDLILIIQFTYQFDFDGVVWLHNAKRWYSVS